MTGSLASCSVVKPCGGGGGREREETAGFFTPMSE